jgi:hypothetical protein
VRGVLLRGVRRGVVLRPFAMEAREEVDGPHDSRTGERSRFRLSTHLGVRFVPGFVSDETRLGCVYIETLAWKARKQPPRDLTRIAHAQQRSLL